MSIDKIVELAGGAFAVLGLISKNNVFTIIGLVIVIGAMIVNKIRK